MRKILKCRQWENGVLTPALQPQVAGSAEEVRPDLTALERVDEDALLSARQEAFEVGLAQMQGQLAQIVIAFDEGVDELDLVVVACRSAAH